MFRRVLATKLLVGMSGFPSVPAANNLGAWQPVPWILLVHLNKDVMGPQWVTVLSHTFVHWALSEYLGGNKRCVMIIVIIIPVEKCPVSWYRPLLEAAISNQVCNLPYR